MHTIYTTLGFIIDSQPYGEAGMKLSIFTRDFGLVMAIAQGIRLEKSKLRYYTKKYSFGSFSMVRGKEFWRLTSAERRGLDVIEARPLSHRGLVSMELMARLALLLRRLLHGEEANPELFDCVENCELFLNESTDLNDEQLKTLESITVLRIMYLLGYVGNEKFIDDQLRSGNLSIELIDRLNNERSIFNQYINKALRESHL